MHRPLIGIIGGMGPHAGLQLASSVLDATEAQRDQEHISLAVLSYPDRIDDRTAFLLGESGDPGFGIMSVARSLAELGATVIGMPCNTAHDPAILNPVLERLAAEHPAIRFLHLIDETVASIASLLPGARRIGLLATAGTYASGMYSRALAKAGLECITPSADVRENQVHPAIYDPETGIKAMAAPVSDSARQRLDLAIDELKSRGAECVILGCTELSLAYPRGSRPALPVVDSLEALARALVRESHPERLTTLARRVP